MGVFRLMVTLIKHPAMRDALILNVPLIECLLIDYNANIHYILQKTITQLNEILYYTYCRENMTGNTTMLHSQLSDPNQYQVDLELSLDELENVMEKYNDDYDLGMSYKEIKNKLSSGEYVYKIIFEETIKYTQLLICSLNKGWIKKVFIALDGMPSKAKMKEQRNRRYIGAHMNNIKEDITKKFKFNNNHIYQLDLFQYRSAICVGTEFMNNIQNALQHLDIGIDIEISTTDINGEGEKKIIHELNKYDSYDNFCIMSPDSDMLILTGLLNYNNKFSKKKFYTFRIDYMNKHQYQFFDLEQLVGNFRNYYSIRLNKTINENIMIDLFFMLFVFGNDFLPKLEPLDIVNHFDFVCESCLTISLSGHHLIESNNLNYNFLLEFLKLINKDVIGLSIEGSLCEKYANYQKLCEKMSLDEDVLKECPGEHHPMLKSIRVNYKNFSLRRRILINSYKSLISFLQKTIVNVNDFESLYKDINMDINDS